MVSVPVSLAFGVVTAAKTDKHENKDTRVFKITVILSMEGGGLFIACDLLMSSG